MAQETYVDFLLQELAARKRVNPQYSLRAFAKNLRVSPAHLSLVINGKKKLSTKMLTQFVSHLDLTPEQARRFLLSGIPDANTRALDLHILSEEEFSHVSEWYHFAVLTFSALENNLANPAYLARRLGVDISLIKDSLRRLQRLGLLEVKDERLRQTSKPILAGRGDIPSTFIRNFHKQILQLAETRLSMVDVTKREYSASTLAIDPRRLPLAKKMIAEFRERLMAELKSESPSEVYVLSMQLFPATIEEEGK